MNLYKKLKAYLAENHYEEIRNGALMTEQGWVENKEYLGQK